MTDDVFQEKAGNSGPYGGRWGDPCTNRARHTLRPFWSYGPTVVDPPSGDRVMIYA